VASNFASDDRASRVSSSLSRPSLSYDGTWAFLDAEGDVGPLRYATRTEDGLLVMGLLLAMPCGVRRASKARNED
jgi:hypothetical protein